MASQSFGAPARLLRIIPALQYLCAQRLYCSPRLRFNSHMHRTPLASLCPPCIVFFVLLSLLLTLASCSTRRTLLAKLMGSASGTPLLHHRPHRRAAIRTRSSASAAAPRSTKTPASTAPSRLKIASIGRGGTVRRIAARHALRDDGARTRGPHLRKNAQVAVRENSSQVLLSCRLAAAMTPYAPGGALQGSGAQARGLARTTSVLSCVPQVSTATARQA